jgi:hypothetical protein
MKLEQLKEAKLAHPGHPPINEIKQAVAAYMLAGAYESIKEIRSSDPDMFAGINIRDAAKDIASDQLGFSLDEMFPDLKDYIDAQ